MTTVINSNASFERVDDEDVDTDTSAEALATENALVPSFRFVKSGSEMHGDFIVYVMASGERIAELMLSIGFFYFGRQIPAWLDALYGYDVSAPYQETSNGDVLLDLGLNFPLLSQTVPVSMLTLVGIVLPIVLLLIIGICNGPPGDAHASLCAYFLSVGMNSFATDMMKIYCAKLRPNFYNMCEFDVATKTCTNDISNAHKSFPSGHSSLAFCAMTILSLYFLGKVGLHRTPIKYDPTKNYPSLATKLFAFASFAIPLSVALFVACSRVHDYYHHPADIVTGALIGTVCALFATSLWYPSVFSNAAGYPLQYTQCRYQPGAAESESVRA